jgi:hypothetical protein
MIVVVGIGDFADERTFRINEAEPKKYTKALMRRHGPAAIPFLCYLANIYYPRLDCN